MLRFQAGVDMRAARRAAAVLLTSVLAMGCAPQTASGPSRGSPRRHGDNSAERRLKLATLPVESPEYPKVADGLNGLFREIQVQGIDDYFMSKVTLEVVQLSIECVEPSTNCYTAVGRSLAAQRLLMAQISLLGPPPLTGKVSKRIRDKDREKDKDRSLKVTITFFNVDEQSAHNVVDRTFKTEDEASAGLAELLQQAIAQSPTAKVHK
jgi:hypothetical protein